MAGRQGLLLAEAADLLRRAGGRTGDRDLADAIDNWLGEYLSNPSRAGLEPIKPDGVEIRITNSTVVGQDGSWRIETRADGETGCDYSGTGPTLDEAVWQLIRGLYCDLTNLNLGVK